jgi:hypothetical protein
MDSTVWDGDVAVVTADEYRVLPGWFVSGWRKSSCRPYLHHCVWKVRSAFRSSHSNIAQLNLLFPTIIVLSRYNFSASISCHLLTRILHLNHEVVVVMILNASYACSAIWKEQVVFKIKVRLINSSTQLLQTQTYCMAMYAPFFLQMPVFIDQC